MLKGNLRHKLSELARLQARRSGLFAVSAKQCKGFREGVRDKSLLSKQRLTSHLSGKCLPCEGVPFYEGSGLKIISTSPSPVFPAWDVGASPSVLVEAMA